MSQVFCIHNWTSLSSDISFCLICGHPWNKAETANPPKIVIGVISEPDIREVYDLGPDVHHGRNLTDG